MYRKYVQSASLHRKPAITVVLQVTAVYLPELSQYTDVMVVPVQGEESLPSMLAGGGELYGQSHGIKH